MAAILYGAVLAKSPTKEDNYSYDVIGKNSEVFTIGDIVTIDSSDGLKVVGDEVAVFGIIAKTVTMATDNETVAKVTPAVQPIDQDYEYLMGTNSDLAVLTAPGDTYEVTGTTGAMQVDVSEGIVAPSAGGVVMITKVDPLAIGGTGSGSGLRQCLVKFVKVMNSKTA